MGARAARYPQDLQKVIGHAGRLAKVLATVEESRRSGAWVVGRSAELRAVVAVALDDWRSGRSDGDRTRDSLASHIDGLHRQAARKLRRRVVLECCGPDDAITAVGEDARSVLSAASVSSVVVGSTPSDYAPTARTSWTDGPDVLARFSTELDCVERNARMLVRRIGESCVTIEDVRAFGREGLLDAARSFNAARGVPFAGWANLRVRSTMIDGVRRWGNLPRRVWRELQSLEGCEFAEDAPGGRRRLSMKHPSDGRVMTLAQALVGDEVERGTPEDLVATAEAYQLVRTMVARLPSTERALVEGHYLGGQTIEQAAVAAGVKVSWGSRLLARAIESMAQEVRQLGAREREASRRS